METYRLTINGEKKQVTTDPSTPLLWVLRDDLKMTGTKYGCGVAACGALGALFVTRGTSANMQAAPQATPSGYNVEHWTAAGQDYWAVSDLNRDELTDFPKAWLGS